MIPEKRAVECLKGETCGSWDALGQGKDVHGAAGLDYGGGGLA